MRNIAAILGVGAACLACCAVPTLGSLFAWLGLASVGSAGLAWIGGLTLPAVALVAAGIVGGEILGDTSALLFL